MVASLKLRALEAKIASLQNQQIELQKQRASDIAQLFIRLNIAHIDDTIIAGNLIFMNDKVSSKDPAVEAWQRAGEKFLRRKKTKSGNSPQAGGPTQPTNQPS
jgi:transcription elongation factor GreA-like protein